MAGILSQIEAIEAEGLCGGVVRVTWDYADLFWSVQLQREYQPEVLEKVIERCRMGKDEVLLGSWGNVGQTWLDAEEFRVQVSEACRVPLERIEVVLTGPVAGTHVGPGMVGVTRIVAG